jgi:hypothetical protein
MWDHFGMSGYVVQKNIGISPIQKNNQHVDFPSGHPPEYYPRLNLFNFVERTGYGSVRLVWPVIQWYVVHRTRH